MSQNSTVVRTTLWRLVSISIPKTATAQVQQDLYLQIDLNLERDSCVEFMHHPVIQTPKPVTCAHLSLLKDQILLKCNGLKGNDKKHG